jgi:membrane-associated HD superfamily phosphohydrolase
MAYGIAPASLVSPLGAIAVISNAILSRIILKESSSYCAVLCALIGAILVILNAPTSRASLDNHQLYNGIVSWQGLVFLLIVLTGSVFIANPFNLHYLISKDFANQHVVCYCCVCSLIGAVTVTSAKVVSTAISQDVAMFTDKNTAWLTYVLMIGITISTILQIVYLNYALMHFGASAVVPVYYIMFTSVSIATGMVLFGETLFDPIVRKAPLFVFGILLAFIGVYLVNNNDTIIKQETIFNENDVCDENHVFHSKSLRSLDALNYDYATNYDDF